MIEPTISASFVAASHRVRLLKRWTAEIREKSELADAAAELQEVVGDPKGGDHSAVAALRAAVNDPDVIDEIVSDLRAEERALLERRLETFDGQESVLRNPIATRVRDDIRSALQGTTDYDGATRVFFDRIVDTTIAFVQSRQNLQASPKSRHRYLSDPGALEEDIHFDYYNFLMGTPLGDVVQIESSNIGGGRADVLLTYGGTRVVAEIKRDADPARTGQHDPYLNQAGLYQSSNVALGLLVVLDLSPKPRGQVRSLAQSIWVAHKPSVAQDDPQRAIVTAIVAGNRPSPSGVK